MRTYRSGKLVPLGNARFALITGGQGSEGHVHAGSLAVHYLTRTADGFERTGSWPGLLVSGTWGAPPDWSIRTDLTPSPTLVVEAGGTWQGYTCSWAHLVELTPTRPVIRVDQISTGYGSGGALGDAGESVEGASYRAERARPFVSNIRETALQRSPTPRLARCMTPLICRSFQGAER